MNHLAKYLTMKIIPREYENDLDQIELAVYGMEGLLGERLQYLRLEKGMTQKELSKVFKVSLKTIQFYEQNRTIPDIYLVAEMAKFFNVSCDYILGAVNTPIPLDEREAEAKDHIYMPKEFMKNKETRRTYKTIVEYVKMVHEMK